MPEGPSIVILKEAVASFKGKKVIAVTGNTKIDKDRLLNKKIISFKTWGKHFLLCFKGFTIRIHLLMFGSYLVNEKKDRQARLGLTFENGELNLYSCAVKIIEGDINDAYDWSADVMNKKWSPANTKKKLEKLPGVMVCDALLDQQIFSGVGNIIKNEILYRVKLHPESLVGVIPRALLSQLLKECKTYSFQFLDWKKRFELKKHFLAYSKKKCHRCNLPMIKKITGDKKRRSFFCDNCQRLYKG